MEKDLPLSYNKNFKLNDDIIKTNNDYYIIYSNPGQYEFKYYKNKILIINHPLIGAYHRTKISSLHMVKI